jgi:hypothetical protein
MAPSQNYRIHTKTVGDIRKFEKEEKREASITASLDYLLRFHKLVKKENRELYEKVRFTLN